MARRLSLAYLTVEGCTPPEQARAAAAAGYECVSPRLQARPGEPSYVTDQAVLRQMERALADTGLSVLDCEIVRLRPAMRVADERPMFEAMARLGARLVLVIGEDADEARVTEHFAALCVLAAPYGILPCLEFGRLFQLHTLAQAVRVVQGAGQANGRVLVDSMHLARAGGTPADVAALDPALFAYAQFKDAYAQPPATHYPTREAYGDRLYPGDGDLPLVDLLRALPPDLPISVEANVPNAAAIPPPERARRALAGMRGVLAAAGE